jgi:hypothetical protein
MRQTEAFLAISRKQCRAMGGGLRPAACRIGRRSAVPASGQPRNELRTDGSAGRVAGAFVMI